MRFVVLHEVAAKALCIAESISSKVANNSAQFAGERCEKFDLFTCLFSEDRQFVDSGQS